MKGSRLRRLFSWHAALLLGLMAVCAALTGAHALQQQVEARALRGATASAEIIVSLVVARNITDADVEAAGVPPEEQEDMDADLAVLRAKGQLTDLRVWSMADGRRIYAEAAPTSAGPAPVLGPADLGRARRGAFVGTSGRVVDVFIPYAPADAGPGRAVVEVQLARDPIDRGVRLWTAVVYAAAAGAILLTVLMVAVSRRRHRRNEYEVRHDTLTGLGNRTLLAEQTRRVLVPGLPAAMLLLDLDGFKEVNDTLGHDAGDRLLETVADRLRDAAGPHDVLVRLGGDEFVVLLPGVPGATEAVAAAERIRVGLRRPIVIADLPVEVDASVGVALAPEHGTDLSTLLKRADVAMYDAKRSGAGVVVYDVTADSREAQHLSVLAELRAAVDAGELRLFYQPKSHTDGRIDEVEALVRWQHPTRGLLPPSEFVPLAERTSLIKPLTAWVLQEAARQCGRWRARGRELSIAVNVSARNLLDDELIETLTVAAAAAGIPVTALQLEITETAVMSDPVAVNATVDKLFRLGVHVSIDDFGVGYTSLSYLSTLSVRALKIDRRFVTDLLTNPVDEILVRNVIHLARDLGLDSIAEGVESPAVWQRLTELGCDEIQGYVLTKPLPPADFDAWLDDWQRSHDEQPDRLSSSF